MKFLHDYRRSESFEVDCRFVVNWLIKYRSEIYSFEMNLTAHLLQLVSVSENILHK